MKKGNVDTERRTDQIKIKATKEILEDRPPEKALETKKLAEKVVEKTEDKDVGFNESTVRANLTYIRPILQKLDFPLGIIEKNEDRGSPTKYHYDSTTGSDSQ